ncbi:MAG: glycosyltransferase family 4 protein [Rhodoferax sp.]|nr:glycosyltransferase family 4 protein [Rhodoferax sp.]
MHILFIHQNFPGQFKHLAPALARRGHTVRAMSVKDQVSLPGVVHTRYAIDKAPSKTTHPWLRDMEAKMVRGEAVFAAALQLKSGGFEPDAVIAHPGWGESLFIKNVWPKAKLGLYAEFFYRLEGVDVGFDPEIYPSHRDDACRIQGKNINNLMHFEHADAALSPTRWQASTFPDSFRQRITVAHDGIDTTMLAPNPSAFALINQSLKIQAGDEIITFVNRNLEPYRGYHVFMRALPALLRARPKARIVIVGADGVSYGAAPPHAKNWKQVFLEEVRSELDMSRVHFVGTLGYKDFVTLLQISMVHVYLTYPFVLSWSLLEAMSIGCAIVASDTAPVREAISHDQTGRLVPFFNVAGFVREIVQLIESPQDRKRLGAAARAFAAKNYDLNAVCLPQQLAWAEKLAGHSL